MMYHEIPGFQELQAEFHEALQGLIDGQPDRTDLMIPLERAIDWELAADPGRRLTMREVALAVITEAKLTMDELRSPRRSRKFARPRQLCMFLMNRLCPHSSLPQIAYFLGKADHTTVMHGIRKATELVEIDPEFRNFCGRAMYRLGVQNLPDSAIWAVKPVRSNPKPEIIPEERHAECYGGRRYA